MTSSHLTWQQASMKDGRRLEDLQSWSSLEMADEGTYPRATLKAGGSTEGPCCHFGSYRRETLAWRSMGAAEAHLAS